MTKQANNYFVAKIVDSIGPYWALCFPSPDDDTKTRKTSPIKKIQGKLITTESGSVYELQDPHWIYLDTLNNLGLEYNPKEPVPNIFINK